MGRVANKVCRRCPICGKEFWTYWDTKVYCSDACKRKRVDPKPNNRDTSEMYIRIINNPDPARDCPDDCKYLSTNGVRSCNYILMEYEKRGCKGGKHCKKYRKG